MTNRSRRPRLQHADPLTPVTHVRLIGHPTTETATIGPWELSALLWRERAAMERLLDAQQRQPKMPINGENALVGTVAVQVEALGVARLERDCAVSSVAAQWSASTATLQDLVLHAPTDAWRFVFNEHLRAVDNLREQLTQRSHTPVPLSPRS